jgi:DNA-binding NarL/FixJ family response regulator
VPACGNARSRSSTSTTSSTYAGISSWSTRVYLLKSEPPERIASFLRGVAGGEAALSGSVARRLLERVREGGRLGGGIPDEIATKLSAREVEVLLLLDEHLGTDEIASRLFISEHTVRSHVKSLLRKLEVSSRREALERLELARG